MNNKEAISVIKNEMQCVLRVDSCDRDCQKCDLVMEDTDVLTALTMAIEALKNDNK